MGRCDRKEVRSGEGWIKFEVGYVRGKKEELIGKFPAPQKGFA
jgi:hypothetical protein